MTTKESTKSTNPYAGISAEKLRDLLRKKTSEYELSLSRGKLAGAETAAMRKDRARILQALTQAINESLDSK